MIADMDQVFLECQTVLSLYWTDNVDNLIIKDSLNSVNILIRSFEILNDFIDKIIIKSKNITRKPKNS